MGLSPAQFLLRQVIQGRAAGGSSGPSAPTAIFLSDDEVAEDATAGTLIGTLLTAGGTAPYAYSLVSDPDELLAIDGDALEVGGDFTDVEAYAFTVRTTDANDLTFDQEFELTVVAAIDNDSGIGEDDGDIVIPDPEDPETDEGGFEDPPVQQNTNDGLKIHGKNGGSATFLKDWGAPVAGAVYTMRYTADWSLMNRLGREAAVGFAFKSGNDFHLASLRGNGSNPTTMLKSKVHGDFRKANQFTKSNDGAAAHGSKDGPNWLQIEISGDGTTYTLRTSSDGSAWTDAYTTAVPVPLDAADDALQFGPGGYFTNQDKGVFSITIEVFGEVGTGPSGWYALVQKSGGDQTISSGEAAITWEVDVSDDQNVHDPSSQNTRFTIPSEWNGRYARFTYNLLTTGAVGEIYAYILKGGAATFPGYGRVDTSSFSGAEAGNSMSAPVVVATGEYYEIFADDGTTYDDADNSWAQIEILPTTFNGAMIQKNADQAISASTTTTITWQAEAYDLDGWFDSGVSTTELTVPSGVSLVRVSAQLITGDFTGQLVGAIQKNGAAVHGLPQIDTDTTGFDSVNMVSAPIAVSAGDDFLVTGFHASAVDILNNNATWFAIEELPSDLKYALVCRSSNQTISSSTPVNWNDEVVDTDNWHDNSTNPSRLTVPSGVSHVRVTGNVITGSSVTGQWVVSILKNGATVVGCARHETNTAGTDSVNLKSAILAVSPGDYFELNVSHTSTTTVGNAAQSWFAIEEVRDAA